jgi:CheY-like chemotaxis protein
MTPTLLLADESTTIQRVVELMFAEQGIKVISVSDGQEAIDHLAVQRPAIALVGVSLQRRDGYEVAAFIQREPSLRGVPVLLLAGAFDTVDEARVRESGAAGVLIKPFETKQVINRVKELLGISSRQSEQTAAEEAPPPPSGRLITSSESPAPSGTDTPADTSPARTESGWDDLRQGPGRAADEASTEGADAGGDEYFEQLDAAFDSLDAQLAGHSVPSARGTDAPPLSRQSPVVDSTRRPNIPASAAGGGGSQPTERDFAAPGASRSPAHTGVGQAVSSAQPNPVFEVDDEWFSKREATAPDAGSAPSAFAVSPRGDSAAETETAVSSAGSSSKQPAGEAAAPTPAASTFAPAERSAPAASVFAPAERSAPAAPAMADAFALMLAEEQGESVPERADPPAPPYYGGPIELSEDIIDRLAQRVADRLMHGLLGDTVTRTVTDVSERLVREEIARIRAAASHKSP